LSHDTPVGASIPESGTGSITPNPVETSDSGIASAELQALRKKRALLLRAKVDAIKRDALPWYRPHPKQDLFHRSTAKRRGVFTGNRFGKSHMGINEDVAWLRGERPWYPESDPARRSGIPQHPVKGLIIANDWDKVQEIFTGPDGKLWRALPAELIDTQHRNHSGAVDLVALKNGSTLRFDTVKSYLSNPQGLESSDWDFIHVDEPCPEPMFKAAARGLIDRNGSAWFTLTALREPWITDAFEPGGIFSFSSFVIDGSIYDNIYLTREAIDAYEATLTDDEKECRLYGKPLHKAGLVYKEFQRDKHVLSALPIGWQSWVEPPVAWSYYAYIDPHPHLPHCVLLLTVDPFGNRYYFYDIFEKCLISQLCARVRTLMGARRFVRVRCDPIAFTEDPVHGTTMAAEFWRCGLAVEKASKDLARGILRVKEELKRESGYIRFSPECRRSIWEINRYHWDEETNKPVDADDHAMECLYRSVLDEPRYVEPSSIKDSVPDIIIPRTPSLWTDSDPLRFDEVVLTRNDLMLSE